MTNINLTCKLIIDRDCEIYHAVKGLPHVDFVEFTDVIPEPGCVVIIGRRQLYKHGAQFKQALANGIFTAIYSNPRESPLTLKSDCLSLGLSAMVKQKKLLLISCGEMEPAWPSMMHDQFASMIVDYPGNHDQMSRMPEIFDKTVKPYKFLFLNGRGRSHRKYLIERFGHTGLLEQSLWTNLDQTSIPTPFRVLTLTRDGQDLMSRPSPIKLLDPPYEVPSYQGRSPPPADMHYVKSYLFNNVWADGELVAEPYIDTYFSLVTETIFDYPYSMRSEKTYKPIAQGHPFIMVSNAGYYRDLHHMGFQTFGHVIDESFDQIENNQDRIERIAAVVEDLCQQDLAKFLAECYNICKYNQQHLLEIAPQVEQQLPTRLTQFIQQHL